MAKLAKTIANRTGAFLAAWREMAPTAVFAGMTLAEFEVASAPPLNLRDEIAAIERLREGKKAEKQIADTKANELLILVVNSLRGTPGFGEDCALYRAFGYVRKSDRKSGLTRKGNATAVDANVA